MSEKCEHRHDDCNRRHGCGGGFALLIVLFILLIIIGARLRRRRRLWLWWLWRLCWLLALIIKTIENSLVHIAQGYFVILHML